MKDLVYDIELQDWAFQDGDFVMTDNPSVQNGGIILLARAFNVDNLILGIGINQIRGGSVSQATFEMNRWKQQIYADSGRATVTSIPDGTGNVEFNWDLNYE